MKFALILVCAGRGKRLKTAADKAFVKIGGVPLFYYSYKAFAPLKDISCIVVVSAKKNFLLVKKYIKDKRLVLVEGGLRRQDSVYNGLACLEEAIDYVFVHDGARPFINTSQIKVLKREVTKYKAVIFGLKIKDALKAAKKGYIKKTLNREGLYCVQTPQAFSRKLLLGAYDRFKRVRVYDDAQMIELLKKKIKIIEGSFLNIKITYPRDLVLAKKILKVLKT